MNQTLPCPALEGLALPDGGAALRAAARRYVDAQRNWPRSVAIYREIYGRALGRSV